MRRKILSILLFCFLCSISLSGCQISYGKTTDYLGLLDDNRIVYRIFTKQIAMYYTYNYDTKETVYLGRTEGFHLNCDTASLLNHHLYFYDVISEEGPHAKNAFYDIDLKNSTVSEVAVFEMKPDNKTVSTSNSWPFNDTIVTIGYESDSQYCSSSLVCYHPDTETWSYKPLGVYNNQTNTGIYPLAIYADGSSLYLIQKEAAKPEAETYYFIQYDADGNLLNRILLSGDILNFVKEGGVWSLYIWNDYIYITGALVEDFLGHIEGEQITEIAQTQLLKSHSLYANDAPVFYNLYEDCYYTLDITADKLLKHSHQMLTGYPNEVVSALAGSEYRTHLHNLFTAYDNVAAVVHHNKQAEKLYFSHRETIGDITV